MGASPSGTDAAAGLGGGREGAWTGGAPVTGGGSDVAAPDGGADWAAGAGAGGEAGAGELAGPASGRGSTAPRPGSPKRNMNAASRRTMNAV